MASLEVDADFVKTFSDKVAGRVLIDISNPGNEAYKVFEAKAKEAAARIPFLVARVIEPQMKSLFLSGLSKVDGMIQKGIDFSSAYAAGWGAFSERYLEDKQLNYPNTSRLFWIREGNLSGEYGGFSASFEDLISSNEDAVEIAYKGRKVKNKGRRHVVYRHSMTFTLPNPPEGKAYTKGLFLGSFFQGEDSNTVGSPGDLEGTLAVMAYLESVSASSRHRPFIGKIMGEKGAEFLELLNYEIKNLTT